MSGSAYNPRYQELIGPPPCRTPGAIYETAFTTNSITLRVLLPVQMLPSNLMREEEQRIAADLHAALLPAIERFYRDRWRRLAKKVLPGETAAMPELWEEL